MPIAKKNLDILPSINQLNIFGYKKYFDLFAGLISKKKIPNSIIISGPKGLGKATFTYHIINYILSKDEVNSYNFKEQLINNDNLSYKLLTNRTHPNFHLIENINLEKSIKIDQVRNLFNFLNKSTYSKDLKIVMIDNAEYLNLNSSNALLKAIEEPRNNTIFFLIHNNSIEILETIKSRCMEFKIFFSNQEKKNIFENIIIPYKNNVQLKNVNDNLFYDTPGNLLKYYLILSNENLDIQHNTLECIFLLMEKYKNEKNPEILFFLSFFIEKFYLFLCSKYSRNLNKILFNKSKILNLINSIKIYNSDEKSVFITVKDKLINETR